MLPLGLLVVAGAQQCPASEGVHGQPLQHLPHALRRQASSIVSIFMSRPHSPVLTRNALGLASP